MKFNKEEALRLVTLGKDKLLAAAKERLEEKSTRRIIVTSILTVLGISVSPEQLELILTLATVVLGYIGVTTKEQK